MFQTLPNCSAACVPHLSLPLQKNIHGEQDGLGGMTEASSSMAPYATEITMGDSIIHEELPRKPVYAIRFAKSFPKLLDAQEKSKTAQGFVQAWKPI